MSSEENSAVGRCAALARQRPRFIRATLLLPVNATFGVTSYWDKAVERTKSSSISCFIKEVSLNNLVYPLNVLVYREYEDQNLSNSSFGGCLQPHSLAIQQEDRVHLSFLDEHRVVTGCSTSPASWCSVGMLF